MPVATHAREALVSLRAGGKRTLLALIGIVVGIGAVIALLTTGTMAKSEAVRQFESLGIDMLSVFDVTRRDMRGRARELFAEDAARLTILDSIAQASPYTYEWTDVKLDRQERLSVQRIGVTPEFLVMHRLELDSGRFLTEFDERRAFAVIGAEVAEKLAPGEHDSLIGTTIRVDTSVYVVVGILKPTQAGPQAVRMDVSLLIPIELAVRERASKELTGITLRMMPGIHYLAATEEVVGHFRLRNPGANIRVDSPIRIIEQMEAQMRMFTLLLGAVGGIALVVGGFGVMNAMLASVVERRLEIGIRRALGARQGDIQRQFLAESIILCLVAGVLGALLGVGSTVIISLALGWVWEWSTFAVSLGVGTAFAAGVFFGYHPARQAARLDPIAAMRGDG